MTPTKLNPTPLGRAVGVHMWFPSARLSAPVELRSYQSDPASQRGVQTVL